MSKYLWCLDAGHGGINKDGVYVTAPKKMYKFDDEFTTYEGQIVRQITEKIHKELDKHSVDYALLHDEVADTPLAERKLRAKKLFYKDPRIVLVSIHSNAGKGRGCEVFTWPGQTWSDPIAEVFCSNFEADFPDYPFRSNKIDGDKDKEEKFAMVDDKLYPAILLECFFFDEREQAELLTSFDGQSKIAMSIIRSILEVENKLNLYDAI